jgi:hypothetical protein
MRHLIADFDAGPKSAFGKFGLAISQRLLGTWDCCDKNVIVPCSERLRVDQNGSERISGKRLKNQVE